MRISGIQRLTLLDFPNHTACIVFTPGCNFRCGYCHNPEFVLPERIQQIKKSFIPEDALWRFLAQRRGLLDGVVVTGGEPTVQGDLLPFLSRLKKNGFAVKLDTNGNRPEILAQAINEHLVDYIAMDIKTSLDAYPALVGNLVDPCAIAKSITLIKQSTVDYEFRTTLLPSHHTANILSNMVELLRGAKQLFLQQFRNGITLDPSFQTKESFSDTALQEIRARFEEHVACVTIRS